MQRLSTIATWVIVVLAIIVFAGAGYVVTRKDPVPHAGRVLALPSTRSPSASPVTDSGATASEEHGSIAFLGDDWTAGAGASSTGLRFSTLVARSVGLQQHNFGVDGTGYAKTSTNGGDYLMRVPDVVASDPDVVVVSGGRNDTSDNTATVRSAVDELFTTLRRKLPDATIVAVAPMWGDSDKPAALAPISAAVREAVESVDGHYLDVPDPIHGHPKDMSDGADPDDAGYAAIASAITPGIRAVVPRSSRSS